MHMSWFDDESLHQATQECRDEATARVHGLGITGGFHASGIARRTMIYANRQTCDADRSFAVSKASRVTKKFDRRYGKPQSLVERGASCAAVLP
jgi:hypothetical protein